MKKIHPYRRLLELNIPVYSGVVRPEDLKAGLRRGKIEEKAFMRALGFVPVPAAGGVFAVDAEEVLLRLEKKQ